MKRAYVVSFDEEIEKGRVIINNWAIKHLFDDVTESGDSVQSFIEYIETLPHRSKLFLYNLNLRGKVLIEFLLRRDYKYMKKNMLSSKDSVGKLYSTTINDDGEWFNINIKNGKKIVKIVDTRKKIPKKISELKTAYGVESDKEIDIVYNAIKTHYKLGFEGDTLSSDAFTKWKNDFGMKNFKFTFPVLDDETDEQIRRGYFGAWMYKKEEQSGPGFVVDFNSFFPSIMYNELLPVGYPLKIDGFVDIDPTKQCAFYEVVGIFFLEDGCLPCIPNPMSGEGESYLTEWARDKSLVLSYNDLQLLKSNYIIQKLEVIQSIIFQGERGLFTDYIDEFYKMKQDNKYKNIALYSISKVFLNSLYGYFGLLIDGFTTVPILKNNEVYYDKEKTEYRKSIYVPMAAYITSIARIKLVTFCQANYEYLSYSDSDCGHFTCDVEDLDLCGFEIDDKKLGCLDIETRYKRAKYHKLKAYYLEGKEEDKVVIAGIEDIKNYDIKFKKFKRGMVIPNAITQYVNKPEGLFKKQYDFTLN